MKIDTRQTHTLFHGSQSPNLVVENDRCIYFTNNKGVAKTFANRSFQGEGLLSGEAPVIYTCEVVARNTFLMTDESVHDRVFSDHCIPYYVDELIASGYDSICFCPFGSAMYLVALAGQCEIKIVRTEIQEEWKINL